MVQPQFIEINAEAIKSEIKADYELMTGRILQPAQVEQLLLNVFAYREYLIRNGINEAAKQNLVAFARAPMLDFLGELVGVRRLLAAAAQAKIKLTLVTGHSALVIPSGIRVQSIDGQAIFATLSDIPVPANVDIVNVWAESLNTGSVGNGFALGEIAVILDPQPYLTAAENITVTSGGANEEADEELRERIRLAPGSFSNAGSKGAYVFFAKSAHPGIADVGITSPIPGQVNIYPLLFNGELPGADVLQAVLEACNGEKVRPLTDTVIVEAPTVINYQIDVELILLTDAIATDIVSTVTANLNEYINSRKASLGKDVVRSQIVKACKVEGVYDVTVLSPIATIVVNDNEVSISTNLTVTVGGYSDE